MQHPKCVHGICGPAAFCGGMNESGGAVTVQAYVRDFGRGAGCRRLRGKVRVSEADGSEKDEQGNREGQTACHPPGDCDWDRDLPRVSFVADIQLRKHL